MSIKRKDKKGIALSRRGFLSLSMLTGASALGAASAPEASIDKFKGWPKSFGMLTDLSACVGCRSCERACNETYNMPKPDKPYEDGSVFKERRWPDGKTYTVVNRFDGVGRSKRTAYRKVQCNHCLEPACATACPIHAYEKTPEGSVMYDEDLCFGCRYCVIACPFNIPGYDYDSAFEPKIVKCIMCYPRLKENKMPACAEACPSGAITFGRRDDLIKLAKKKIADNPDKYINHIYGEYEVGGTSWLYISDVPFEDLGFPTNIPDKPIIELTKGYMQTVPIIFTTFPAIFGLLYAATHKKDKDNKGDKE
jgi:Fe-S-cluster-containing dehydrogenase component